MRTQRQAAMETLNIATGRMGLLREITKGCQALASDGDENLGMVSGYDLAYFLAEIREKIRLEEKEALGKISISL
jgi:uncharacterized protein YcfJ